MCHANNTSLNDVQDEVQNNRDILPLAASIPNDKVYPTSN